MNWYKLKEKVAWELCKQYIVFHPEQFFNKLDEIEDLGLGRIPALDRDDAGLWLYALDWNDPCARAIMVPDLADHPEIQVPKMLDPRDFSI